MSRRSFNLIMQMSADLPLKKNFTVYGFILFVDLLSQFVRSLEICSSIPNPVLFF